MDLATLIGLIGAVSTIVLAIATGGSAGMFMNPASIAIVLGGTLMITLMRSSLANFIGAVGVAGRSFR